MRSSLAIVFLCVAFCASAQELGQVDFASSAGPAAQKQFLKGLLELHSFEYDDAREDFQAAEKTEPDFAMAYWGEAMTYDHPVWHEQDTAAARAVLRRIPPRVKANPEETLFVQAVKILFGEGAKPVRDRAYSEAMRAIYEKYPHEPEAACFYALSLLGTTEGKRDTAVFLRAAAILEPVFRTHPRHPGAAHYLIHCYDDPAHARLGLAAARAYASIAPAAEHAQHMPSHIFFALGMWDEAVASNEVSWSVSEQRVVSRKLSVDQLGYHALYWLEYAYLQQGRYQDARRVLGIMEDSARRSNSARVRSAMVFLRATYLAETGQWTAAVQLTDTTGLGVEAQAADRFVNAMARLESRLPSRVESAVEEIRKLAGDSQSDESTTARIMADELEAALWMKQGKIASALAKAASAASEEDRVHFEAGPPALPIPAHEFYGELLLRAGRRKEAAVQFHAALVRAPGRTHSLLGLARTGDKQALEALRKNWHRADAAVKDPVLAEFIR